MADTGFGVEILFLDALASDPSSPEDGMMWCNTTQGVFKVRRGVTRVLQDQNIHVFSAADLISPVNAGWAVNALAPLAVHPNHLSRSVRLFDDTVEEGVGFSWKIPSWALNMKIHIMSSAVAAPPAARTVGIKIYSKGLPDNAAEEAWSSGTQWNDADIPVNIYSQYDSESRTLASLGLTAGREYQFELTRVTPSGGTNLEGNWALERLSVEWT